MRISRSPYLRISLQKRDTVCTYRVKMSEEAAFFLSFFFFFPDSNPSQRASYRAAWCAFESVLHILVCLSMYVCVCVSIYVCVCVRQAITQQCWWYVLSAEPREQPAAVQAVPGLARHGTGYRSGCLLEHSVLISGGGGTATVQPEHCVTLWLLSKTCPFILH